MRKIGRVMLAAAIAMIVVGFALPARIAVALPGPTAEDVMQRLMQTVAAAPDVFAANAEFRLRVKKPVTDPPDCVFKGTVTVANRHATLKFDEQTTGLLCWAINRFVLGRQFQPPETLESFLSQFDYQLLGEKLVGNSRYYLVEAKAKDPKTEPNRMIGWIDFDRGLLVEGTMKYGWGSIDNEQGYARMQNIWMLTYQYLYTSRFGASMEVLYNNFRFGPQ